MHPLLTPHKHPQCAEIIEAFKKCHEEHPVAKFWGVCNNLKHELDQCFRQEKVDKRKKNLEAARQFKEKLEKNKAKLKSANVPRWTEMNKE